MVVDIESKNWMKKKKTSYCGISAVFEVTNVSSRSDRHPKLSENRYYGYLEDIIQCDFKSFKVVLFVVKWYRLRLNNVIPVELLLNKIMDLPW